MGQPQVRVYEDPLRKTTAISRRGLSALAGWNNSDVLRSIDPMENSLFSSNLVVFCFDHALLLPDPYHSGDPTLFGDCFGDMLHKRKVFGVSKLLIDTRDL